MYVLSQERSGAILCSGAKAMGLKGWLGTGSFLAQHIALIPQGQQCQLCIWQAPLTVKVKQEYDYLIASAIKSRQSEWPSGLAGKLLVGTLLSLSPISNSGFHLPANACPRDAAADYGSDYWVLPPSGEISST